MVGTPFKTRTKGLPIDDLTVVGVVPIAVQFSRRSDFNLLVDAFHAFDDSDWCAGVCS
jgi:hypothetical protein